MRIAFLQVITSAIEPYAKYSRMVNKDYCEKHGYDYIEENFISSEYHPSWGKVFATLKHLDEYDYIFTLDADAIVVDSSVLLEDKIKEMKGDILFSNNGPNGGRFINAGSFITNSKTRDFFNELISRSQLKPETKFGGFFEQDIINDIYDEGRPLDVKETNFINSYWLANTIGLEGLFVFHFMARSINDKVTVVKDVLNSIGYEVCDCSA